MRRETWAPKAGHPFARWMAVVMSSRRAARHAQFGRVRDDDRAPPSDPGELYEARVDALERRRRKHQE